MNERRELAKMKDIPAFMICSDSVLRELTLQKPTNSSALLSIKGIGEKFLQNYGEKFLEVIRMHVDKW
jgi:ATP-dependent DNA helicase RecQ